MKNIIYKDLDLTFNIHPVTKDISISSDQQAIVRSIRNLILTQFNEKPFNPNVGSSVRTLLFEPVNVYTAGSLKKEIELVIKNFEPRVNIIRIDVEDKSDYNSYYISIYFNLVGSTEQLKIDFALTRLR